VTTLNDLVAEIKIETAYLPTLDLKDPFAPNASTGAGHWALEHLKPKVTIVPRTAGVPPLQSAPFGEPGPTHWPQIKTGLTILAVVGAIYGARRLLPLL